MAHTAEVTSNVPQLSRALRVVSANAEDRTELNAMITSHAIPPVYPSAWFDYPDNNTTSVLNLTIFG